MHRDKTSPREKAQCRVPPHSTPHISETENSPYEQRANGPLQRQRLARRSRPRCTKDQHSNDTHPATPVAHSTHSQAKQRTHSKCTVAMLCIERLPRPRPAETNMLEKVMIMCRADLRPPSTIWVEEKRSLPSFLSFFGKVKAR